MTIGTRIKERRLELGLSIEDVSKKLRKNRATVYRYESDGILNLPTTVLEPLAEVLQTTPAALMGWDDKYSTWDEKYNKNGKLAEEVSEYQVKKPLPSLTPKDEREIVRDLEAMLDSLDNKSGMAAFNEVEDEEDRELLKASLEYSMRLAKQMAKKKYTPKKYRKE